MSGNNVINFLTKKVEGRDLYLERVFNAPRELVFKVFSEEEHLKRWWGAGGWTLPICQIDFRPGGVWHYCMQGPEGEESWGKAIYHEIVEPERIVYTDVFSDKDGNQVEGMPEQRITLTFVDQDGKTKLINHSRFTSVEGLKTSLDMGLVEGMSAFWDSLAAYLEELS